MLTTYPIRMQIQTGWPALEYWSTIFTWLASDMTFLGAILFLSILIFIWAKSWREAIVFKNPLSIVLFCNLGILWIFVPQNNQLMQTLESTVATILLVLIWLIFHKYFNNIKEVNKEKSIDANK